jgi:hypothetical protein
MGLDCDTCCSNNLHEYHILLNGCEVCSECYGRRKELERQKKECEEEMKQCCNTQGFEYRFHQKTLEKLEKALEFTPEELETGKGRILWRGDRAKRSHLKELERRKEECEARMNHCEEGGHEYQICRKELESYEKSIEFLLKE